MYLKKLKMVGFKSFAHTTEVLFDKGITCIVGPNGCGKSNISDCIRWVLGEQSAKSLRGSKMQDIIFNGADSKKALSMAEVAITFDNADRRLGIDFDEVTVMRRVFRSGESEYYINKTLCRLKDIHELFYDTGVGTDAYSSLEQGKIDLIVSSKPEDRKEVFEEAAGITKYKNKKKEALRRLEYTESNLVRLDDIIKEVRRQINSVNRQAAKARKYKDSFDRLKELDIKHSFYQYEKFTGELEKLNAQKIHQEDKETLLSEQIEQAESELVSFRETFNTIDSELSEVHKRHIELERDINTVENSIKYNSEKLASISETEKRWQESIGVIKHKVEEYKQELEACESEIAEVSSQKEKIEESLNNQEQTSNGLNCEISDKLTLLQEKKNIVFDTINQESKIKNELTELRIEHGNLQHLGEKLKKDAGNVENEIKDLEDKAGEMETELVKHRNELETYIRTLEAQKAILVEEKEQIETILQDIGQKQSKHSSKNSQRDVLLELKNNYEGFFNGVRALMLKRQEDDKLRDEIEGVVADVIEVESDFELAMEVVAGSRVQNLIMKSDRSISYAVSFLKKNNLGRATFLALNMIRSRNLHVSDNIMRRQGVLGYSTDFIKCDKKYQHIVDYVFGNSIVVEDIDTAIDLSKQEKINCNIVTLQGELVNPSGAVTGGSMRKNGSGLLGRETQIKELDKEIKVLEKEINDLLDTREALLVSISDREKAISLEDNKKHQLEIQIASADNNLKKTIEQVQEKQRIQQLHAAEIEEIEKKIQNSAKEMSEINEDLASQTSATDELKAMIAALEEEIKAKEHEKENFGNRLTNLKIEFNAIQEKENNISLKRSHLLSRLEEQQSMLEDKNLDLDRFEKQKTEINSSAGDSEQRIEILRKEKNSIMEKLEGTKAEKSKISSDLISRENIVREKRDVLVGVQKELRDAEVKINQLTLKEENVLSKMNEEYGIDITSLVDSEERIYEANTDWVEVENEVLTLRKKLSEIGPVNLMAIEEHDELQERYDHLSKQQTDLVNAKNDLLSIINKINATTKDLLQESFCKIRENFREIFVMLFGGGKADLYLTDEKNILEAGIEIIAKPPGKKPQHISLLSGGERSMVAVALLFSIYKEKPSPFCLLDEIDAALDEANIHRFVKLLKMYTEKSQFIVITHNKKTIGAGDALYGVTMEQAGISKLVSVRFKDKKEDQVTI